jgi:hypothetical protein
MEETGASGISLRPRRKI